MYHVKNKYTQIYIFIVVYIFLLNIQLQADSPILISFKNDKFQSYLKKSSNYPITFLTDNWQIFLDGNLNFKTVNTPFLVPENTKKVSFKNTFTVPDSLRDFDLKIWFLGINGIAQIMVNKILVKDHVNSISSFYIDIPNNMLQNSSKNLIEITISNPKNSADSFPSFVNLFQQKKYIGISREIYLEWIPQIHYSDFQYSFQNNILSFSYAISINQGEGLLSLQRKKIPVEEIILSPEGKTIFKRIEYINQVPKKNIVNRIINVKNPILWSPENPSLYKLTLKTKLGSGKLLTLNRNIGLRKIESINGSLHVNKSSFLVRGINYREKYIDLIKKKQSKKGYNFYSKVLEDFINIKNAGFNTIKFHSFAPHPYCIHIADSLGLFLLIENSIRRMPEKYFLNEKVLSFAKEEIEEIKEIANYHPSIMALGLGSEISIQSPSIQKFILILNEFAHHSFDILTYISPIDYEKIPKNSISDFYIINKYGSSILPFLISFKESSDAITTLPVILGNVGYAAKLIKKKEKEIDIEKRQYSQIQDFLMIYRTQNSLDGFFIESYQDWLATNISNLTINVEHNVEVYPYGLLKWNNSERFLFQKIHDLLQYRFMEPFEYEQKNKKSNFFSLTIFFSSILFFLIYRRNHRFKENILRTLSHPYGFFVDLRDRRIISTFNSSLIGLFSTLLIANFLSAFLYYFNDNLLFAEIFLTTLTPSNLNNIYFSIGESPFQLTLVIWMVLYISQVIIAILLKIINFLFEEKIKFRQFLAACNWSGTPLLFFLPVSFLSYHLFQYNYLCPILFILLSIFIIWYNVRIANGIRILLILKPYKIFALMLLTYTGLISTLIFVLNLNFEIMDYILLLFKANNLY